MASYGEYGHNGRPQDRPPGGAGYGSSTGYDPPTIRYGDGGQYHLDDQQQHQQQYAPQYGGEASQAPRGPAILTNPDFLERVDGVKTDLDSLTGNIASIASAHQRAIAAAPDARATAALDNLVANTQVLNARIRDQIRFLELDAARSGGNATKNSQVRSLKTQFRNRLEQYQQEEVQYKKRYQEQIARQYRIVNPAASEDEVREAVTADWGDEGVFQTAVRTPPPALQANLTPASSAPTAQAMRPRSSAPCARATTTSSASNARCSS
jgi:syntaxin 1B/2/3